MRDAPLWTCPRCGRPFANRNQPHSCVVASVEEHLAGKGEHAAALFRRFAEAVEACGPVTLAAAKTRVGFQARVLQPRFRRIESLSPRNHVHHFRIRSPDEIDAEVAAWLREAYAVGRQEHLG